MHDQRLWFKAKRQSINSSFIQEAKILFQATFLTIYMLALVVVWHYAGKFYGSLWNFQGKVTSRFEKENWIRLLHRSMAEDWCQHWCITTYLDFILVLQSHFAYISQSVSENNSTSIVLDYVGIHMIMFICRECHVAHFQNNSEKGAPVDCMFTLL